MITRLDRIRLDVPSIIRLGVWSCTQLRPGQIRSKPAASMAVEDAIAFRKVHDFSFVWPSLRRNTYTSSSHGRESPSSRLPCSCTIVELLQRKNIRFRICHYTDGHVVRNASFVCVLRCTWQEYTHTDVLVSSTITGQQIQCCPF